MSSPGSAAPLPPDDRLAGQRRRMVQDQIARRGVRHPGVLAAMQKVPRHRFVPGRMVEEAHSDRPLPIGHGQTISQPYIVACMIEALELPTGARVLDVGTGSGYQAAVLAAAGYRVCSIELVPDLAAEAADRLRELGFPEVALRVGDGNLGWPEEAPFDGIVVAAAAAAVPPALLEQLAPGGRLVIPIGTDDQILWRYRRTASGFSGEELLEVRFVPLIGGRTPHGHDR